jgi:hypothetical protein
VYFISAWERRLQCVHGQGEVKDVAKMAGMNLDGFWKDIPAELKAKVFEVVRQ